MSILLEALRKSEKDQRPQTVPTIHTGDESMSVFESLKIGPLAILLVTALFASGWFVWHQYQLPTGSYQSPVTLTPENTSVPTGPVKKLQTGSGDAPQSTTMNVATKKSSSQQRTPVESYQETAEISSQLETAGSDGITDAVPEKTLAGGAANQSAPQVTIPAKPAEPTPETVAPAAEESRSREPAPISYWELPDAIRATVPEIKFSVLVYDSNPGNRFVLINGQRFGEGDVYQPGLAVKEIRRDGVVFSYRLYQFLVER